MSNVTLFGPCWVRYDSFHVNGVYKKPTGLRPHEFSNTSHGDFLGKGLFQEGGGCNFSAEACWLVETAYGI